MPIFVRGRYIAGMQESQAVLGLFAKWPVPGAVKTRLARDTSCEFAVQVADAFLRDCLFRYAELPIRRIVVFDPPDERERFLALIDRRWELMPQIGVDLGVRLRHFFDGAFQRGATRVVAIGTDSPTMPPGYLLDAFERLNDREVVLGPATDGGYYLIGLSRPAPELFADVRWSANDVLRQTIDRLGSLSLALLPPWYDVDTLDDWTALRGHLAALCAAGQLPLAPNTEQLSAAWGDARRVTNEPTDNSP